MITLRRSTLVAALAVAAVVALPTLDARAAEAGATGQGTPPQSDPRALLTVRPPTNVSVQVGQDGFTVWGTPSCSNDFKSCLSWIEVPQAGVSDKNVQTTGGRFVPWPNSWAEGSSISVGTIRSYGVSVFGYGYYSASTSLGTITRPYRSTPVTAEYAFAPDQNDTTSRVTVFGTGTRGSRIDIRPTACGGTVATAEVDRITGRWSTTVAAPNRGGDYDLTVQQTDAETAKVTSARVSVPYGDAVSITSPVAGAEPPAGPLHMTGNSTPRALLEVRDSARPGVVIGNVRADANGRWELDTAPLNVDRRTLTVTATGRGGNVTTAQVSVHPDGGIYPPGGGR